jgi:1-phosphatidylinositol phosphodiesterase
VFIYWGTNQNAPWSKRAGAKLTGTWGKQGEKYIRQVVYRYISRALTFRPHCPISLEEGSQRHLAICKMRGSRLIPFSLVLGLAATSGVLSHHAPVESTTSLAQLALQKVLNDASPIFGDYTNSGSANSSTSQWMRDYPDNTLLVHMNIPGTHDTSTWNYSQATQDSLKHVTDLNGLTVLPPEYYRCQSRPIVDMLEAGIRVFDLRFAFDATNTTLVFYHSQALQSETATVEDVLFGFYQWLDCHPSEAVLLSFQYEGSTKQYASNNADVQLAMFNTLTSDAARKYFVQAKGELGPLGEARGKITLLRRFDLDQLPQSYSDALPGLHFSPSLWFDNDPDIALVYNTQKNLTAYIEDYYGLDSPIGSGAALNIQWKYNATTAHLTKAATQYPDSLFWSFASSEYDLDSPIETPEIMALGNGTEYTPLGGVNQRLVPFLQGMKGKRVGIVMFDFYQTPSELVQTLLDL